MTNFSSPLIGLLKWISAQVIVAHHMSIYGPLAQKGHVEMPLLFNFFTDCGAWAVSVFLVIAGFLAAKTQDEKMVDFPYTCRAVADRYLRLIPVYLAGLVLSTGVAIFLRPWVSPDMLPEHLDAPVWMANAFFLQDILGLEALSAGVWYVAIDLQLYAFFLCLSAWPVWMGQRKTLVDPRWSWAAVGLWSLAYFNLHPEWNVWAIYFAGTYALGALAFRSQCVMNRGHVLFYGYIAGSLICAWVEPRPRLLVAILTAALLHVSQYISISNHVRTHAARKMGDSAYGIFMSHFALLMLVSCLYPSLQGWEIPLMSWLLAIFVACNVLGWLIWRYIDLPAKCVIFQRDSG